MNTVKQESWWPSSGGAITELMVVVENCIQELIAFNEVISEIAGNPDRSIDEWVDKNLQFIDDDSKKNFHDATKQIAEEMTRIAAHIGRNEAESMTEPFEGSNLPFSKEVGIIVTKFFMDVLYRVGNRAEMISRAFLIAAESSFEVLFGKLVRAIYVKNPSALPKSDQSLTLEQLLNYASIDEAREELIGQKIERLLRESIDEWAKLLEKTVSIKLDQIMSDWPTTREIFIRRNMLVHTDGRITDRYLRELQRAGKSIDGLSVGQSLTPSVDYLQQSLQRLVALEVLLVFRVWSRQEKRQMDEAAAWLSGRLEVIVLREMWEAACLISDSFGDTQCKRSIQLAVKINGWLAYKSRDGVDRIYEEVSAWDVSSLDERYVVIKKLLLNTLTEEELAYVIQKGIFSQFEVSTSPLFANIRQPVSLKLPAV